MNPAIKSKPWRGLLASFILSGAGQFLSGARRRGITWFLVIAALPLFLPSFYCLSFVPAKAGVLLFGVSLIIWLTMLCDSYRAVAPLRWWAWALLILLSVALSETLSLLSHRFFEVYRVPTMAMAPTISRGDHLLICRSAYWFSEPHRGDLIVFDASGVDGVIRGQSEENVLFVKRVVGMPNDVVEIGGGNIWVNNTKMTFGKTGDPIRYTNLQTGILTRGVESYAVPVGEYFVLGDNSANSYDSRYWGSIRQSAIRGKVMKIYWPWGRMSTPR